MKLLEEEDVIKTLFQWFDADYIQNPKKFPVRGFLKNILNKTLDYAVYVNTWPEFNTVIVKPSNGQAPSYYRVGIYTSDPKSLLEMLLFPRFLPQMTTIRIYGLAMELVDIVEDVAEMCNLHAKVLSKDDSRVITTYESHPFDGIDMLEFNTVVANNLPPEFEYCTLETSKHTDVILSSWMDHNGSDFFINKDEEITALKTYLSIKPAVGVIRKTDDQLVAWMLSDMDTSGRIAIAAPEYRGHAIVPCMFAEFARQSLQCNDLLWGYTPVNNISSNEFAKKIGSKFYDGVDFVHCILRPKNLVFLSHL